MSDTVGGGGVDFTDDLGEVAFIPPVSAGWKPPGEARRTVCNPDNPGQTYTLWTGGYVKAAGGAPEIKAANPPIILDYAKGERAMDLAIFDWYTPGGYIFTNWARVWPFGGVKTNAPEMLSAKKNVGAVSFAMDPMANGSGYWLVSGGAVRGFGTAPALPAADEWLIVKSAWGRTLFKKMAKGTVVRDWTFDWATKRFMILHSDGTIIQSTNARSSPYNSSAKAYLSSKKSAKAIAYNFPTGEGYVLDHSGGIFPVGKAKSMGTANPYWPNRNVARDLIFQSWGGTDARRYFVLDLNGALHDRIKSTAPTLMISAPTGVTEVQQITYPVAPTGGSFRVQRVGLTGATTTKTSAPIPWNATETTIRNILWAMFGDFDATVTLNKRTITVTFGGPNQEGEQPLLQVVNSSIVPATATPVVTEEVSGASPAINSTTTPSIGWTYKDAEDDRQGSYEVQVWKRPTSGWPTAWRQSPPATSGSQKPYWSTKGTGASTRSVEVTTPLTDGEYRVYVRATEYRGLTTRWANLTFTVDLVRPLLPDVALSPNYDDNCVDMTITDDTTGSTDLIAWERSTDTKTWTPVRSSGAKVNGATFTDDFDRGDADTLGTNWTNQGYPMGIREEHAEAGLPSLTDEDLTFSRLFLFGDAAMGGANQPPPTAYGVNSYADALREVVPRTLGITETFSTDTATAPLTSDGTYMLDDFTRPSSTTLFGLSPTGDRWQSNGSTWQVTGGFAKMLKKVSGQRPAVTIDSGSTSVMVQTQISAITSGDSGGVIIRSSAYNTRTGVYLLWQPASSTFSFAKILSGTEAATTITVPGDWTWTPGTDTTFGLAAAGSTFYYIVDGSVRGTPVTIADAALQTGTRVGLATGTAAPNTSVRFNMIEIAKASSSPPSETPLAITTGNWQLGFGSAVLAFQDPATRRAVMGTDVATPDGTTEVNTHCAGHFPFPIGPVLRDGAGAGPAARIRDGDNFLAAVRCNATGPDLIDSATADRWGLAWVLGGTPTILPADTTHAATTDRTRVALQLQGRYARLMVRNRWQNISPRYTVPNGDFALRHHQLGCHQRCADQRVRRPASHLVGGRDDHRHHELPHPVGPSRRDRRLRWHAQAHHGHRPGPLRPDVHHRRRRRQRRRRVHHPRTSSDDHLDGGHRRHQPLRGLHQHHRRDRQGAGRLLHLRSHRGG